MSANPFAERPEFKKRIVNASLTEDQHAAFLKLQSDLGCTSASALIKRLLREEIDRQSARQSPPPAFAAQPAPPTHTTKETRADDDS